MLEEHVTPSKRSNIISFYCSVSFVEVPLEKCRRNRENQFSCMYSAEDTGESGSALIVDYMR